MSLSAEYLKNASKCHKMSLSTECQLNSSISGDTLCLKMSHSETFLIEVRKLRDTSMECPKMSVSNQKTQLK